MEQSSAAAPEWAENQGETMVPPDLIMIDEDDSPLATRSSEEDDDDIQFIGEIQAPADSVQSRKRSLNGTNHQHVVDEVEDEVVEVKRQKIIESGDGKVVVNESNVTRTTKATSEQAASSPPDQNGLSYMSSWRSRERLSAHATNLQPPKLDEHIWARIQQYRNKYPKKFAHFDKQIIRHYELNIQNDTTYCWKMQIRKHLLECIQGVYPSAQLFVVGSTINGCGSLNADMDLCCSLNESGGDTYEGQRKFALKALRKIRTQLFKHRYYLNMQNCILISAKVPILRVSFFGPHENLEVDLNVNNLAGIYNSYLVHYYSRIDDRFPALCLLIKHWAKRNQIGDAVNGMLNSYSLILLVIHFLQAAISPPILPNLQETFPHLFTDSRPLNKCLLFQELEKIYPDPQRNKKTIGELLIAFFDYYSKFDFDNWAISISRACVFPRYELPMVTERFKIYIEEPYDGNNTARCVTSDLNYELIKDTFKNARSWFLGKRRPDIRHLNVQDIFKLD